MYGTWNSNYVALMFRNLRIYIRIYQKYLRSFKMCCWRGMEEINWLDRVKDAVVIHRVKEDTNILHAIKRKKTNWTGHILRRYRLLKHVIEVIIYTREEVMGRRGKGLKQLPLILKKRQNTENWKRKNFIAICGKLSWEGALDLSSDSGTSECVWNWDVRFSRQWL